MGCNKKYMPWPHHESGLWSASIERKLKYWNNRSSNVSKVYLSSYYKTLQTENVHHNIAQWFVCIYVYIWTMYNQLYLIFIKAIYMYNITGSYLLSIPFVLCVLIREWWHDKSEILVSMWNQSTAWHV